MVYFPGREWAIFKLGFPGRIKSICVDTTQFKGNFPDSVKIEGVFFGNYEWTETKEVSWRTILKSSKVKKKK